MTLDYPPLSIEQSAAVGMLYQRWSPDFQDSRVFNVAIKLPALLAELALLAAVLTIGARCFGSAAARWCALAMWLNPALIVHGAMLGYLDSPTAVPAALSVVAAYVSPAWLAGVLLGVAAASKPQAVLLAPFVAVVVARHPGTRVRAIAGMIAGIGLVAITTLGPFIVRGSVFNAVRAVAMLTRQEGVSDNAANVWWIFTWLARAVSYAPDIGWLTALTQPVRMVSIARVVAEGFPNPRVVGTTIVVAAWAWAAWRASRSVSPADILAWAGWSGFVYFLFAAQVHENHLYLAVILFCLAAALDDRFRWVFWGLSASSGLNLMLFYGIGREFPKLSRAAWGFDVSLLLVAANLVLFAATTRLLVQTRTTPAPKTAPAYR